MTPHPGERCENVPQLRRAVRVSGYDYLALDPEYTGSCPCATFEVDGTKFDAHCWRTCNRCEYAGLHYEGDRAVAERVFAAFASMQWSEWTLVEGLR